MRSAFLDDAEPEAISHAVRGVLERRGALITEHRHSRVLFAGLKPNTMSWTRAGYVGIYQALGEREAEVRLTLRARWPWRILWGVAVANVAIFLLTVVANPPGTTWSILAILTGLALIAASVLYVGTLKSVRAEETGLMEEFERAFALIPDVVLETDEERELRDLEAELEGEIVRRRIEKNRPPPAPREKGKRFSLKPRSAGAKDEADPSDARRARLLARKAELEARRAEAQAPPAGPPEEPKP
ncbi:MAG TPA: hypothetical protein VM370_12255 [Candidatus Thermoplasmatota archaeon]|nr:hypothetical protein [Candidatus Thermoplasmatota archaeon]